MNISSPNRPEGARRHASSPCVARHLVDKDYERKAARTVAVARVPAIMPHVSSSGDGGDELATEDEIKLYKHEGEEDKTSSENLTEDKSDLIDLTESEVRQRKCVFSLFSLVHLSPSPLLLAYLLERYATSFFQTCVHNTHHPSS